MLSAFASLMMLYIVLAPAEEVRTPQEEESGISAYEIATAGRKDIKELSAKATHTEPEIMSDFTEEITEEFNCLMYATIPIGRYYITAYNHEETGSKITASGKTCREGTITTCAIDPKLHRFGQYFEIDGRLYVSEDTGRLVKRKHIDLYFSSYKAMARYGSNYQTIYRVEFPFGKPKEA